MKLEARQGDRRASLSDVGGANRAGPPCKPRDSVKRDKGEDDEDAGDNGGDMKEMVMVVAIMARRAQNDGDDDSL